MIVGVENPVVIDSLWKSFLDFGRDVEEVAVETCKMAFDVDTIRLTADEVNTLINGLENLSYNCDNFGIFEENHFTVDYDLPENGDRIVKIEVRGDECPEDVYYKVFDYLNDFRNIDYTEGV